MKQARKKVLLEYLPLGVTFVSIVTCAILFKQALIKTLPVCFSLVIVLLNARANRIAFLLGASNSLLYIVGYYLEGVYGSMITAVFSACLQTASFFLWKRRAYKQATEFRVLSNKNRILLATGLISAWAIASYILSQVGGNEYVLDGLVLVLGFTVTIMQMLALIDSCPLNILNVTISLTLWTRIILNGSIANVTYLISSAYTLYMVVRAAMKWITLYKEQQKAKALEES